MTQLPCFLRMGERVTKYRCFPLTNDQVQIGRSPESTYSIMSAVISRCHATIQKQTDNSWTITDNNSVNGTAVNGTKLKPLVPQVLHEGDEVTFGVPTTPGTSAEFVYRFFTSLKVKKESHNKRKRQTTKDSDIKRCKGGQVYAETTSDTDSAQGKTREDDVIKSYEEKLRALAEQLKEKETEKLTIQQQLQVEREQRHAIEQVHKEQKEKVNELDAKQKQLQEEKAAVELQMQKELQIKLQEREDLLCRQMQQKLAELAAEKQLIEERLQTEMMKAVQEKNKQLQDQLLTEKQRLQKVIETKALEQKALESQLAESRLESEQAKADTLKTREAILSNFVDTMETELQCSICSELFVQATSLNCAHSFCALCIRQWLAVKKECPVCRAAVTSQVRSYVLDNYIDRMVEQLSDDLKQRRADLVTERKECQAKLDEAENKQRAGPSGAGAVTVRGRDRTGGRARGRGQAGRGSGATGAEVTTTPPVAAEVTIPAAAVDPSAATATVTYDSVDGNVVHPDTSVPIVVIDVESDDETDSNEDNFSSDWDRYDSFDRYRSLSDDEEEDSEGDYIRGSGRSYYGGYGRCFKCGSRGHWANGCPF